MSEPVVEPAPAEPVEPAAAEPAAPAAPDWGSPEAMDLIEERAAEIAEARVQQHMAQLLGAPAAPQQEDIPLDPFADDFGSNLRAALRAELQQAVQPLYEPLEAQRVEEGEQRAKDILADIAAREGDFDQGFARKLAESFIGEARARYGPGPRAAEAALNAAARETKRLQEEWGRAYHERQMNELRGLSGAPRQPGAAAAGAQQRVVGGYTDGRSVSSRYFGPEG